MVHTRQVGDRTLTFIVSGKLWRNSLIMQDVETNSLWSHITGDCMDGELKGSELDQIPSVQTTWAAWVKAHPDTRVLKKSEEITSSRYQGYFDDPEKTGLFRTIWLQDRMPGKDLVHGIVLGVHQVAVTDGALVVGQPLEVDLGGTPITVTREADGGVRAVTKDGADLLVRAAFWFAWSAFYPNTAVVDQPGG